MRQQESLFPFENPLRKRLGDDYFSQLPKTPGVYLFLSESGHVLYVGKAKNLKLRLQSYKRARPDNVARKVIRLLRQTYSIRIEEVPSEAKALLRENELLREHRPFYNVVNKEPESYFFLALREKDGSIELRLTTKAATNEDLRDYELYGSFKGRHTVREGYGALLRLLWMISAAPGETRFEVPPRLLRYRLPASYTLPISVEWRARLRSYLRGTRVGFLEALTLKLLENLEIPPFYFQLIARDLKALRHFFDRCLKRNRHLFRKHRLTQTVIAQDALDDLMVHELLRLGRVQG